MCWQRLWKSKVLPECRFFFLPGGASLALTSTAFRRVHAELEARRCPLGEQSDVTLGACFESAGTHMMRVEGMLFGFMSDWLAHANKSVDLKWRYSRTVSNCQGSSACGVEYTPCRCRVPPILTGHYVTRPQLERVRRLVLM